MITSTRTHVRYWSLDDITILENELVKLRLSLEDRREVLTRHIVEVMEDKLTVLKCAIQSLAERVE